ncbi:MAG: DNA gyrase subunit A [Lachnospiraceae bacterium]|nr:DNA gyrase subunit A [Lachnospiraceae bacterium]
MDENIFDKVNEVDLKKEMETSYIDYAMSVIASRALPDVRDGLKPVQRRILFAMSELNNGPDKPHRKCARIVGDTMGKYHPHGDSSIYGALVNLAQEWNTRYPLIDGHGNFGSVDGDGAAAMRYTEARLSKISVEMLADIGKDTVDFIPNFDETENEPTVLPSRYPNLLVNGTQGIAVGMATNIPPHNLREVIDAVVKIIDNRIEEDRDTDIEEVIDIVKGPDFPTGAEILGKRGIIDAYRTGRGKIRIRAVTNIEPMENGKNRIVVTELPYMVNKAKLIEKISQLHRDKRIDGITDLRDETNREGMRVCIELRRDVNPNIVLNQLYKHTQMQDTFGVIMLALYNNEPVVMNLLQMLKFYLKHQEEVVTRRTRYDLNKAEERAHILEGLLIALDNIDEVIKIIRASKTTAEAKSGLIERFGLSDNQAQAIVDMRLRALTGLEREKIEEEYASLQKKIAEYKAILADEKLLLNVIKTEITVIRDKYGDDRRTSIGFDDGEFQDEDLIPKENTVITLTHLGYIKRMTEDNFKSQHRGGRGIKGIQTIKDDYIEDLMMTTTHHYLLFLTNKGRIYKIKAYEIPVSSRISRGTAIVNILPLQPGENISAIIPMSKIDEERYLFMVTKKGIVKKTSLKEYANIRRSGIQAINLREDDELIEVKSTNNKKEILLISKNGQCMRFHEKEVRSMGRSATGVIGMKLNEDDCIVAMQMDTQGTDLLIVTEKGMGKRTKISEFPMHHRGGKGVKCYKITPKTGYIVGAKAVNDDNEIMVITENGIIIQTKVNEIRETGRDASGVKIINIKVSDEIASDEAQDVLKENNLSETIVASITKVRDKIETDAKVVDNTDAEALEPTVIDDGEDVKISDILNSENNTEV